MYRGKHEKPIKGVHKYKKSGILLASLVLIFALTIGSTVAFLIDITNSVKNTFSPVTVKTEITESFDHQKKDNIVVWNKGTTDVFVRATVAIYWTDAKGAIVEPEECSYTPPELNSAYWAQQGDIYYYKSKLTPGEGTQELFTNVITATIKPENANYTFHMQVLGEAIQAEPTSAVIEAWGVDPTTLGS